MTDEIENAEEVENEEEATTSTESEDAENEETQETEETAEDAEEPPKKKSRGGFQKRIDELTKARYEAEQRAQTLEHQLREVQQQSFKSQYEQSKPTLEQFDHDYDAWAQAYEQWVQTGVQKQQEAQQEAYRQAQMQQEQMRRQMDLNQKMLKAQEKYPDFQVKVFDPNLPQLGQINQAALEALVESEHMADVAYYLASNPSEVYKFGNMTPIQAVKEVARLEAKFSKPAGKTTAAPPPPKTVSGKSESVKDPAKMTTEEWMEWRKSQVS